MWRADRSSVPTRDIPDRIETENDVHHRIVEFLDGILSIDRPEPLAREPRLIGVVPVFA
jgi:hypothetical protein